MDVLFTEKENKVNYDFKGRLSFSWPKLAGHKELNWGDESYDPLFSYGFGLSYGDVTITELFDEEIDIDNLKQLNPNLFFTKGKLNTPWQFFFTLKRRWIGSHWILRFHSILILSLSSRKTIKFRKMHSQ